jgi:DNA-binding PadR family transcriptional regulator
MRNHEFHHSPHGRGKNNGNNDEGLFGDRADDRSGRRRRHGPHHEGGRGEHFRNRENPLRGGRRRGRGDVRLAILALLEERPMHGYEMMQELSDRTQGLWQPSPGSIYPALQLLEDQGLVRSESADGRRQFTLTDAGRAELKARPEATTPWDTMVGQADQGDVSMRRALRDVVMAFKQVAQAGTTEQKTRAGELMIELRRQMYLLLAEAPASREG